MREESDIERKKGMEVESTTSSSSLLASATPDELTVSLILLGLKKLMSLSESLSDSNWGRRRKRSCLESPPPLASASSPSPEDRIEEKKLHIKAVQAVKHGCGAARTTGSPDTTLNFPPSESDEKLKHSLKKSSKKRMRREDHLDRLEALTQGNELLRGEIENKKKTRTKLKAFNSRLKAIQQEVSNSGTEPHRQPDHTAQECQDSLAAQSDDGLASLNQSGPRGFDLNLPAEEAYGVDVYRALDSSIAIADRRTRFAEARRNRIARMKSKQSRIVV